MKEEIKKLMDDYESGKDYMIGLCIYSDGSGHIFKNYPSQATIHFEFNDEAELIKKLKS